jgi:hypothetical protein
MAAQVVLPHWRGKSGVRGHASRRPLRGLLSMRIVQDYVAAQCYALRNAMRFAHECACQCTLTVSSSWLQALASAASRLSVSMIGVPSAACSA